MKPETTEEPGMGVVWRTARTASLVFSRNPLVRPADRLLSAMALAIAFVAMAVVPIAATVGSVVHAERAESAVVEQQTRHRVLATLQEATPSAVDLTGVPPKRTSASALWRSPDGRTRFGTISVPAGLHAGDTTPIWVDETGAEVAPPRVPASATVDGLGVSIIILAAVGLTLGGSYWLVRWVLLRRARRVWEQRWRDIEPRWTGRKGREPA